MRKRLNHGPVFVASSRELNGTLGELYPIEATRNNIIEHRIKPIFRASKCALWLFHKYGVNAYDYSAKKQNRFIERFLPRTEEQLDSLLIFLKNRKFTYKKLRKSITATVEVAV